MNRKFEFRETKIKGLIEVTPFNADDNRGCFTKDYSKEIFHANGIYHDIAEVFYSTSKKGVIRGMHFQYVKQQAKLVRCLTGHIYDVVIDLRFDSKTFKQWISFDLSAENCKEILVPFGCAHGFLALEESIVSYKCNEAFCGDFDSGIYWNDPDIGVEWGLDRIGGIDKVIISEKDKKLQRFAEYMQKCKNMMKNE